MCGNPDAIINSIWLTHKGMRPVAARASEGPEKITDGLRIYHNPYAMHPLPLEVFRREGVVQLWADSDEHALLHEEADNCLQSRTAITFLKGNNDDFKAKAVP